MTNPKTFYRRNLPHYQPPEGTFHVVFRLAGSLPAEVIERLRAERISEERFLSGINDQRQLKHAWTDHHEEYFEKFDELLDDSQTGPRWLCEPPVAEVISEAISHRDGKVYDLLAYCVMPNHVHTVLTVGQQDGSPYKGRRPSSTELADILENLKWYTALNCNRILGRGGQFWQHESYDHLIRNGEELERTIWYVLNNPVRGGLTDSWENWKWKYVKLGLL